MNSFELSRKWFNWSFENPEKVKPIHTAIYFFAIEHCNRLGGKEKFGFPSQMTMEALGIKSYNTYSKALNNLFEWGFFEIIERSKNQYSANIISLFAPSKNDKARDKALDKALIKHSTKHCRSTVQSIVSINKPINQQTNKPEREAHAIEKLKKEKPSEFEIFTMQNKSKVENWVNLLDSFNDTIDIELEQNKIDWNVSQLMPRLRKFTRSWISNQKPNQKNEQKAVKPKIY